MTDNSATDSTGSTSLNGEEFLKLAEDGVITLDSDVTITSTVVFTTDLTINLGTYTITGAEDVSTLFTNGGAASSGYYTLTADCDLVINGSEGGSIYCYGWMVDQRSTNGSLTVNGGTYTANPDSGDTRVFVVSSGSGSGNSGVSSVSISDAIIVAKTVGIWISYNGTAGTSDTPVTITNCKITTNDPTLEDVGIYLGTTSYVEISGTTVDSYCTALEVKCGSVAITDSDFSSQYYRADPTIGHSQSGGSISALCINDGYATHAGDAGVSVTADEVSTFSNSAADSYPVVITTGDNKRDITANLASVGMTDIQYQFTATANYGSIYVNGLEINQSGGVTGDQILKLADSDGKITLTMDICLTDSITIPSGSTYTIDLAGYTITNRSGTSSYHTIINWGTVTIVDSVGGGVVDNIFHARAALYNAIGGTANLNGGTFTRSLEDSTANSNSWYVLKNHGTMTIDGATVEFSSSYSSMISNGYQNLNDKIGTETALGSKPLLTIKNGTFSGGLNTVKNDEYGILVIEGGSFSNTVQSAILNWNQATISGGDFEVTTDYSVLMLGYCTRTDYGVTGSGELTISGGTFTGTNIFSVISSSEQSNLPVIIYGGTFNGSLSGTAVPSIYAGTFSEDPSTYVVEGCTSNESSGVYTVSVDAPTISISESGSTATVTITSGNDEFQIFYTTDGSTPTDESTAYVQFTLSAATTVKAVVYIDGVYSDVVSATYTPSGSSSGTTTTTTTDETTVGGTTYTETVTTVETASGTTTTTVEMESASGTTTVTASSSTGITIVTDYEDSDGVLESVSSIIESVTAAGVTVTTVSVEIEASSSGTAEVPVSAATALESYSSTITVTAGDSTVGFDAGVIGTMGDRSGTVTVTVKEASSEDMGSAQLSTVGSSQAYVLTIADSNETYSILGGNATVTVPVDVSGSVRSVSVYYVDANGDKEYFQSTYSASAGTVTFTTTHFSIYMIEVSYDSTVIIPDDNRVVTPSTTTTTSSSSDDSAKVVACAAAAVAAAMMAALVFALYRRK